jgi:hypothetical protein
VNLYSQTGKMKNRKNWTFATLWPHGGCGTCGRREAAVNFFPSRIGSDGSQSCWLRERRAVSRGVHSAIGKVAATYTEEGRVEASTQHCGSMAKLIVAHAKMIITKHFIVTLSELSIQYTNW